MKSSFYEEKKSVWISKEAHKRLQKDAMEMNFKTLGELASLAIIDYSKKLNREEEKEDKTD